MLFLTEKRLTKNKNIYVSIRAYVFAYVLRNKGKL